MFTKKRLQIGFIAIAIIIIGVILFLWLRNNQPSDEAQGDAFAVKQICSEDVVKRSAALISDKDSYNLAVLVESDVTSDSDFNHDINCLYIYISMNFLNNTSAGMSDYVGNYKTLYGMGDVLSSEFGPTPSPQEISRRYEEIKRINDSYASQNDTTYNANDSVVGDGAGLEAN